MNQSQRNYLIKKVDENIKAQIKLLEGSKPEQPTLSNFLLHAVLSNAFEIKPTEVLKEQIRQKALNASQGKDWLGADRWGSSQDKVTFSLKDFFEIPDEYTERYERYKAEYQRIEQEIRTIQIEGDTLITRITLASDKTLQTLINEVDDMGSISLMQTKLKELNG